MGYTVNEGPIAIEYIMAKAKEGKVEEIFGTGTAAVISPVGELYYQEEIVTINNNKIGDLTKRLYETLTGIQYGRLKDDKGWITKI